MSGFGCHVVQFVNQYALLGAHWPHDGAWQFVTWFGTFINRCLLGLLVANVDALRIPQWERAVCICGAFSDAALAAFDIIGQIAFHKGGRQAAAFGQADNPIARGNVQPCYADNTVSKKYLCLEAVRCILVSIQRYILIRNHYAVGKLPVRDIFTRVRREIGEKSRYPWKSKVIVQCFKKRRITSAKRHVAVAADIDTVIFSAMEQDLFAK